MPEARHTAVWLAPAVLIALGYGALLLRAQAPASGPVPVAWDRATCAHCRMLVSEPRFAAQLRTSGGEVLHFDDPGCLLLWRRQHPGRGGVDYLHHVEEDRWVEGDRVVFVPAAATPMGHGLGARERDEAGGLSWAAALEVALRREAERQRPLHPAGMRPHGAGSVAAP